MLPYYVIGPASGAGKPEFLLMLPLSVAGKNQMAGLARGSLGWRKLREDGCFPLPEGNVHRRPGTGRIADQFRQPVLRGSDALGSARFASHSWQSDRAAARGHQLIAIEPVYIEAEQTKIPTLARVVLGQLLPDDRKIEWAPTLLQAERLIAGVKEEPARAGAEIGSHRLGQARARSLSRNERTVCNWQFL